MTEQQQLFGAAPYAKGSDTSKEAAESVEHECTSRIRGLVFATVRAAGRRGMTCDEVEVVLGMKHQTASARCNELVSRYHLLVDSGERRPTRSGRKARVLVERGALSALHDQCLQPPQDRTEFSPGFYARDVVPSPLPGHASTDLVDFREPDVHFGPPADLDPDPDPGNGDYFDRDF